MDFILLPEFVSIYYIVLLILYQYDTNRGIHSKAINIFLNIGYIAIIVSVFTIIEHQLELNIPQLLKCLLDYVHLILIIAFPFGFCSYIFALLFKQKEKWKMYLFYVSIPYLIFILFLVIRITINVITNSLLSANELFNYHYISFGLSFSYYLIATIICNINKNEVGSQLVRIMLVVTAISLIPLVLINTPYIVLGTTNFVIYLLTFLYLQNIQLERDYLTKLYNRTSFMKEAAQKVKNQTDIVFVLIDLENYKAINNRFGQNIGDEFLKLISEYLKEIDSKVYRFGGDEFMFIMPNNNGLKQKINMISSRFKRAWIFEHLITNIPIKISVLIHKELNTTLEETIVLLEEGIKKAQNQGITKIIYCTKTLKEEISHYNEMVDVLKNAIKTNRILLQYLPIYDNEKKCYIGAEALLRIVYDKKNLCPKEFIDIANNSGMILSLDLLVIRNVLATLKEFDERKINLDSLSFNLSSQHFKHQEFAQELLLIIRSQNIDPKRIIIDVQENVMSKDSKFFNESIEMLVKEGVRFHLDDFGVGYSNLASVLRMPFEMIKIDGSLIDDATYNKRAYDILKSMVDTLKENGINVLAECVETTEQWKIVQEIGIKYIQGCHFSCPISREQLIQLLGKKKKTIA